MPDQVLPWVLFLIFIAGMLAIDLGVFHRKCHVVKVKEALIWSGVWIALALVFNVGLYFWRGTGPALEFLTGYFVEKSLSVDNIFVFVLIFAYFRVPALYHHRILFLGIIGALVLRAIFIFAGIALVQRFHWLFYLLGVFLVVTGIKMIWLKDKEIHPERNPVIRLFRRLMPVTENYEEGKFFVRRDGRWFATPLFLVLLFVELTDVIFAVDSIPAIMGITLDPFIIYTSNAMAILGLRSLYFALAGVIQKFYYPHYGLSAILVFIGIKMLLTDMFKVPVGVSLSIVAGILVMSVIASLLRRKPAETLAVGEGEAANVLESEDRSPT